MVIDPDSSAIRIHDTLVATVRELSSLKVPRYREELPRQEVEKNLYRVDAFLVGYKKEGGKKGDQDYHIVIRDLDCDSTMIVEIPDPFRCPETRMSPFYSYYIQTRTWFETNVCGVCKLQGERPTLKYCPAGLKVRIVGTGFIDKLHGQIGRARFNGIELHPVLEIRFIRKP